ncbi:MAG: Gfo/Idh/MocA family oxidoreductase [Planctomycetes bacterium]|nr:Gfo/Idh/MocA family oxidoreductase [Planctomycetota bacterium]
MDRQSQRTDDRASTTTRRRFLGAAGAASLALAPRFLPAAISSPPGEKLNIAGVGIGGMGHGNIRAMGGENIVALCDVDQRHAGGCFRDFPKAAKYIDYRKMLETQKDIEAVMVATPDHMHAPVAMMAIRLGKHVYCEKPLTHTVFEARELAKAAREHKVATQMGNRGQASEGVRFLCEWIWDGAIGPVRELHLWTDRPRRGIFDTYWPQGVDRPADAPPVPDWMTWDLWLGVAPERPYHPAYAPFVWRGWWDFGTGALGDIGCHALDAFVRALRLGPPESVEACSSPVNDETYPVSSIVTYQFPARGDMPPLTLIWYDGGLRPPRPVELEEGRQLGSYTNGALLIGDKGKMMSAGSGSPPVLIPEAKAREYKAPPKTLPRSIGHYEEWIAACKGGDPAGSSFDHAGPLTETVLLGNIALRRAMREKLARKRLMWDSESMKFPNAPEANPYVHKEYRAGWTL